ncbi:MULTISPECIES: TonB-dependent receptor [unclassified Sphingopyxis]|uniref:TonB-dependent receptor n=1 Tax=unclassified Sphingopyxis TaxID=2614943 RepID=UPI0028675BA0|nr:MULTISPECIES: TonB-dependent receptor [unclassified Sphingopyxis]MDR7059320.1 outer membrane receptor protein involved in Fe transport [Sphingopyxis sp. BE235]MDR7178494.1 outer membrane receptor protein involved in Fe transport [Sphingopyxis sp. BE249]
MPSIAAEQDATQTAAPEAEAGVEETAQSDIVVTGSARAQRRFDVSYAVNSLGQEEVQRIAPKNFADLLGTVPGIQVEATGGEVQNITRVRGIPTDRGYLIFQQDGLPLYHEIDGVFFNSGEGMNRFDLMTERVEIVRGGPAPIYASSAAAIANNITVSGGPDARGKAQLTLGDTGLYRLDAMQSGPIGERTYFAIGGFLRQHDGYRDGGFPSDKGGQIRANLKHDLDNGFVKVSMQYTNDHNIFYLPIPVADPRNPSLSLDPYIDYHTGTLNSPALRNVNVKYRDGAGVLQGLNRDLADGRHMRFFNVGLQYEGDFDGWLVSAKGGFTKGKSSFDAFYSTTNPVSANTFAASYLTAARTAFGADVARLGYAVAGTNGATVYDPGAASGLIMSGQYRVSESDFYSGQADLSVTRKFETGLGTHDVRIGVYGAAYGNTLFQAYQDMLIEVQSQPRTIDLVAYSATGAVLGSVTQNGVLRYTTTLNQGEADAKMVAVYANDTWEITDGLRVDGGIRKEWYDYEGFALLSTAADLGDTTTLADNATRAFSGAIVSNKLKPSATNWTAGVNYDFTDNFGAYGRVSNLEVPPQMGVVSSTAPTIIKTKARQYELGVKASFGPNYLYVTGFYTKFDPFNATFIAFNPVTGRNDQPVPFIGEAVAKGVEVDGRIKPVSWFELAGSVTWADPQYRNLANTSGADPTAVNGNQIIREAKFFGNVRPSVRFPVGGGEVEIAGRYEWVGRRYVDLFNLTALPAYQTFGASASASFGNWRFQVVGDNLTNAKGLTEGNPRTDQLAGQGASDAIYGRPLFGRSFRFILSRSW